MGSPYALIFNQCSFAIGFFLVLMLTFRWVSREQYASMINANGESILSYLFKLGLLMIMPFPFLEDE